MAKKILLIDDEPDLVKITTYRLKKMGYDVVTGVTGMEAFDLIRSEKPDLVLLDIRLPVIDGLEICKKFKADEKLKNIPIILFTASASSVAENLKESGADSYLIKPFTQEELAAELKKFFN